MRTWLGPIRCLNTLFNSPALGQSWSFTPVWFQIDVDLFGFHQMFHVHTLSVHGCRIHLFCFYLFVCFLYPYYYFGYFYGEDLRQEGAASPYKVSSSTWTPPCRQGKNIWDRWGRGGHEHGPTETSFGFLSLVFSVGSGLTRWVTHNHKTFTDRLSH